MQVHHLTCLPVLRRARLLFTRSEASMSSYGSRARLSTLAQLSTLTRLPQHGPSLASAKKLHLDNELFNELHQMEAVRAKMTK